MDCTRCGPGLGRPQVRPGGRQGLSHVTHGLPVFVDLCDRGRSSDLIEIRWSAVESPIDGFRPADSNRVEPQAARCRDRAEAGFGIAPGPLLAMFVSIIGGRLAERVGNGPMLVAGGLSGAIGLSLHLVFTDVTPSYVTGILIPGLFIGVAAGLGFAQVVGATMASVPPGQYGMAGAGRTTVFQLAVALGIAMAFTIIGRWIDPQVGLDGYRITWIIGLGCYLVQALVFGLFLPRGNSSVTSSPNAP